MTNSQKNPSSVIPFVYETSFTMDTGATGLSIAVDLYDLTPVGLRTSTDWTNADITFQLSYDNTTYVNMYESDGTEYTVTVTDTDEACYICLDPADFSGAKYIKVRSGTAGTPVEQGDARTLYLYTRRVG